MTSRAKLAVALRIAQEGRVSRARVIKFGGSDAEYREKLRRWEWALRVLERKPCAAARRRDGKPCRALNEPGKRRCKWHGGLSTGPKTAEGRAKALANLRQYRERNPRPTQMARKLRPEAED